MKPVVYNHVYVRHDKSSDFLLSKNILEVFVFTHSCNVPKARDRLIIIIIITALADV